jgi:hypothetical protein
MYVRMWKEIAIQDGAKGQSSTGRMESTKRGVSISSSSSSSSFSPFGALSLSDAVPSRCFCGEVKGRGKKKKREK